MRPKADLPYLQWEDANGQTRTLYPDVITSESHGLSASVTEHPIEAGGNISDNYRMNPENPVLTMVFSETPIRGDLGVVPGLVSYIDAPSRTDTKLGFTAGDIALALAPVAILAPEGAALAAASILASAAIGAIGDAIGSLLGVAGAEAGQQALRFPEHPNRKEEAFNALLDIMKNGYLVTVSSILARYEGMAILEAPCSISNEGGDALTATVSFTRIVTVESETTAALPIPAEPRAQKKKAGSSANSTPIPEGEETSVAEGALRSFGL